MEFHGEMHLPLYNLLFLTYLPVYGAFGEKKEMGQLSGDQTFIRLFITGFLPFQMGESNEDIDQMFSNLLGEMDLLTQVNSLP